jgi:hypothetical protein
MTAMLTLEKFFNHDLPNVASNSNDSHLYRIYLCERRFATAYTPIADRGKHPLWFEAAKGLKSYLDMNLLSEYYFTGKPEVLTPFLATLVTVFNIRESDQMKVTQDFYDCIRSMEFDIADLELTMRDPYVEIH